MAVFIQTLNGGNITIGQSGGATSGYNIYIYVTRSVSGNQDAITVVENGETKTYKCSDFTIDQETEDSYIDLNNITQIVSIGNYFPYLMDENGNAYINTGSEPPDGWEVEDCIQFPLVLNKDIKFVQDF